MLFLHILRSIAGVCLILTRDWSWLVGPSGIAVGARVLVCSAFGSVWLVPSRGELMACSSSKWMVFSKRRILPSFRLRSEASGLHFSLSPQRGAWAGIDDDSFSLPRLHSPSCLALWPPSFGLPLLEPFLVEDCEWLDLQQKKRGSSAEFQLNCWMIRMQTSNLADLNSTISHYASFDWPWSPACMVSMIPANSNWFVIDSFCSPPQVSGNHWCSEWHSGYSDLSCRPSSADSADDCTICSFQRFDWPTTVWLVQEALNLRAWIYLLGLSFRGLRWFFLPSSVCSWLLSCRGQCCHLLWMFLLGYIWQNLGSSLAPAARLTLDSSILVTRRAS